MSLETTLIDCSNEIAELTFHDACAKGKLDVIVNYLVHQGFDMYIGDNSGRSGFHLACLKGNLNVVKFLLQQGFDMYTGDNSGRTGFHLACLKGNLNVVQFLLQQKFDMNVGGGEGNTGFHFACFMGNLNVVQLLLQKGFDMYVGTLMGRTGFHLACFMGNLNVVQFLLRRGFDMNVGNINGFTGFHGACIGGKVHPFLIEQGFDSTLVNDLPEHNTNTRFPLVCRHGNLNVVQYLLQQGFDMNLGANNGATGFHIACVNGNLKVVEFLVQQGFDMNTSNNHESTGFITACAAGNSNIIWFLLHHGFDNINEISFDMTALDILIYERRDYPNDELYMPCILLLIESGGEVSKEYDVFEELISAIQNRIIEITFMKKTIDQKWTGRIAQLITDFTMEPFTDMSLQNLSNFLDDDDQATRTICSLF